MGAGQLGAVIGEGALGQALEGHALEVASRDDPVGVDVVADHRHAAAQQQPHRTGGERGRHQGGAARLGGFGASGDG